jgi:hypothetical protein
MRHHVDLDEVMFLDLAARRGSQDDLAVFASDRDMSATKLHVGEGTVSGH